MSVQFTDQNLNEAKSLEAAYTGANPDPLSGLPVSVLLWVYFEAAPTGGETHTVWWFGQANAVAQGGDPNDLVLEAVAGTQGTVKLVDTIGYEHLIVELRCVEPDAAKGGGGYIDAEPLVNAGFMIRYG